MRFSVLASGSTGNATLVQAGDQTILIDAGISGRRLKAKLLNLGVKPEALTAIIISHEHIDHVSGLSAIASVKGCPIYLSAPTRAGYLANRQCTPEEMLRRTRQAGTHMRVIHREDGFMLGNCHIQAYPLPHDAAGHIGVRISYHGQAIIQATDIGYISAECGEFLNTADALLIESNHCRELLAAYPGYPYFLKKRIASDHGHLANAQLAHWLNHCFEGKARHIALMHLSLKTNTPAVALLEAQSALQNHGWGGKLEAAGPDGMPGWHAVAPQMDVV